MGIKSLKNYSRSASFQITVVVLIISANLLWFLPTISSLRQNISQAEKLKVEKSLAITRAFFKDKEVDIKAPARYLTLPLKSPENEKIVRKILKEDYFINVSLADVNGNEVLKYSKNEFMSAKDFGNVSQKIDFKMAIERGKTSWSKVRISATFEPFITINAPVFGAAGEIIGVLSAEFSVQPLFKDFSAESSGNERIYVVDKDGLLISHPDSSLVLKNTNLSDRLIVKDTINKRGVITANNDIYTYKNEDGVMVLSAGGYFDNPDLVVVYEEPRDAAFSEMRRIEIFFVIAFLFIGSMTLVLRRAIARVERARKDLENSLAEQKKLLNIVEKSKEELEIVNSNLQSERDKSVAIITSVSEGLYVVDGNYKIILMNPAAERLFGCKLKECLGKDPRDIISTFKGDELLSNENRPITRTIKNGENVTIGIEDNFYFQIPSGRRFPVTMTTSPIKTKELTGAVVVFRDITDDKLLDEAKSSFISIASHQLRTPLTSVRWYSEMLMDEDMGALNKDQKEFASQVHEGALRLFQTIDTLLALSRLESGKLQEDPVKIDLKLFMEGILKDLEPLLKEKNLSLSLDLPPDVPNILIDRFMFREAVTNLIANSIRYTNIGGKIKVSLKKDGPSSPGGKKDEGQILCSVSDNGIGIPDEDKDKIFARFYRAQNAMRKVPDGSGLGLSLVKSFVEKWGGRIWFESKLGEGTTFYLTIPAKNVLKSV